VLAKEEFAVSIRIVRIGLALIAFIASSVCSRPAPPAASPPLETKASQKPPRLAFAGTINVPRRRAVRGDEMTSDVARRARQILDENTGAAFGTEIPFEVDGHSYVGRIEEHYHEPGGSRKPWGRHRGVTVYHAE
jgi:hypothetical protein